MRNGNNAATCIGLTEQPCGLTARMLVTACWVCLCYIAPAHAVGWTTVLVDGPEWRYSTLAVSPDGAAHIVLTKADLTQFRYRVWRDGQLSEPLDSPAFETPTIGGASADWCPDGTVRVSFDRCPTFGAWGDLMLATVSEAGWRPFETLVAGSFGYCTSIACDPEGHLHISYRAEQDGGLLYWTNCPDMLIAIGPVDWSGNPGRYSQIAVDSQRRPHIAYSTWGAGQRYAHWNGQAWEVEQICQPLGSHRAVALVLDSLDQPHVSWHDANANLTKYWVKSVDGQACCTDIASPEDRYTNIDLGPDGIPVVAALRQLWRADAPECPTSWTPTDYGCSAESSSNSSRYFRVTQDGQMYVVYWDPSGVYLAFRCASSVDEQIISDSATGTYAAADQFALSQTRYALNTSLRYQIHNVANPTDEVDQLFLAAGWEVLSTIYDGHPGTCPGELATWALDGISLATLSPGSHTLYAVRTAAMSDVLGRVQYEIEHGGWRVAIGQVFVPPACRGDCDCDGQVGFSDIDYFVAAIPNNDWAWAHLYETRHNGQSPPCSFANCDIDGSGVVDFVDIDPFVALIPAACP